MIVQTRPRREIVLNMKRIGFLDAFLHQRSQKENELASKASPTGLKEFLGVLHEGEMVLTLQTLCRYIFYL
jgi:hypothetical protein